MNDTHYSQKSEQLLQREFNSMCISFYNLLIGVIGVSRGKKLLAWINYNHNQKCLSISFGTNVMYLDSFGNDHADYRCYPRCSFPQDFTSLIYNLSFDLCTISFC